MILHYSQTIATTKDTLLSFHSTMILHYSQTPRMNFPFESTFHSTMILHYSQTVKKMIEAQERVSLNYDFTLLSNRS